MNHYFDGEGFTIISRYLSRCLFYQLARLLENMDLLEDIDNYIQEQGFIDTNQDLENETGVTEADMNVNKEPLVDYGFLNELEEVLEQTEGTLYRIRVHLTY